MKVERIPKNNDFEHLTDWMLEGVRVPYVLRIWCSRCSANEVIRIHGGVQTTQQGIAEKLFRQRGWSIGRRRKSDVCPHCVQRERDERAAKRLPTETNIIELKPIVTEEKPMPVAPVQISPAQIAAAPPREMSRTDKRIIFNKLEEVYVDENVGYGAGWNDQKVATDLGVPLDWVRTLRDENFGPEGHSPEARIVFDETRKMIDELRSEREKLMVKANELTATAAKLALEADRLDRKLTQIEKGKL